MGRQTTEKRKYLWKTQQIKDYYKRVYKDFLKA